jgi:choline dehydrogenase-like flavoprotein
MSTENTFDYVIVGGGTAGVTFASRLRKLLPLHSIAILESVPDATYHAHVTDPNALPLLATDGLRVNYETVPQAHCDNRSIPSSAGRMLSGSSGANFGVWNRASTEDYQLIAERAGSEQFTFENLLPYFKKVETYWDKNASREYHGFEGAIHTVGGRTYPMSKLWKEASINAGHKENSEPHSGNPLGISTVVQNFRATSESSSERQHASRVHDLLNVTVICSAASHSPLAIRQQR